MATTVQNGYLVLADISGYTSFMAENELVHAQEIMSELLNCVVAQLTSTLTLAEVEGDAVFSYAPETDLFRGETLLELIEATYVAFRDRLLALQRQTSCICQSCRSASQLDLKFVTHFGEYVLQSVAGKQKPVGSAINLVHRLLKNSVTQATGWQAYALFTDHALAHMGILPLGTHEGVESYDHLGHIATQSVNLHERHAVLLDQRRVEIPEHEAQAVFTQPIAAPPPVVWEWLHDPEKRTRWMDGTHWTLGVRASGRSGVGAESHCAHGKRMAVERILDWHPFHYFATEAKDGPITIRMTIKLIPIESGTQLEGRYQVKLPLPHWLARPLGRLFFTRVANIPRAWKTLARLVDESRQARTTTRPEARAAPAPVAA